MRQVYESLARGVRLSRGFTLIELLVVVAIIAILAAMAIPRIQEYRRSALIAKLTNNARICLSAYAQQEALSAIGNAPQIEVPDNCQGDATSCTCTEGDVSVTCNVAQNGSVNCSVGS